MKKRILVFVVSLALVFGLYAAVTSALEKDTALAAIANGNLGTDGVKWKITDAGVLRIYPSSAGEHKRITQLNSDSQGTAQIDAWPWYAYRGRITKVQVEPGVGVMPNVDLTYLFANLSAATEIDISGFEQGVVNDDSQVRSLKGMFTGCSSLETIIVDEGSLFSAKTNSTASMFSGCSALTVDSFKKSDGTPWQTVTETQLGTYSCAVFSWLNMANVTSMKEMFQGCSSLQGIDMSAWTNNGKVYEMQRMFKDCKALEAVILNNSGFKIKPSTGDYTQFYVSNNEGGVQMPELFFGCKNLRYVDMSNITLYGRQNWTGITSAFYSTPALEEVNFSNTKFLNTTSFSSMFAGLENLKSVDFAGAEMPNATYMDNMFYGCTALEELDLSGLGKLKQIVSMGGLVGGGTSLKTLNLDNLDNSHIGPTNNQHWMRNEDPSYADNSVTAKTGAREYRRDLGLQRRWLYGRCHKCKRWRHHHQQLHARHHGCDDHQGVG